MILREKYLRLTRAQRDAVLRGSGMHHLGAAQNGVQGSTMVALARKGLAETRWEYRPYRRLTYRLTDEGSTLRASWMLHDAPAPPHKPLRVRCTHCGEEFDDGTHGGACGACGMTVAAICERCGGSGEDTTSGFRLPCKGCVNGLKAVA